MSHLNFEGVRYSVRPGECALDALVRGGARVSFSCRKGSCRACLLRSSKGDPGNDAQRELTPEMKERGYFLPCLSHPREDLALEPADLRALFTRAVVQLKIPLSPDVVGLTVETETRFDWRAGQYVNVRRPGHDAARSYSLASIPEEDYYVELHVRRVPGGAVSPWLCDELNPGDTIELQGPLGACVYDPADQDRPLLLVAGGTGLAPLVGVARDALRSGHRGAITLAHGARQRAGLYLHDRLTALAARHPNFTYVPCVSEGAPGDDARAGLVTDVALDPIADLRGWGVYLAGSPEMVYAARPRVIALGAEREHIHADPFTTGAPFMPDDRAKLASIAPDPELWAALEGGPRLRRILTSFYARVFADARLAPYFQRVTRDRVIDKQYEFLAMIFSGTTGYFGLNPFNAHHWMVIDEDLFDHRERIFTDVLREDGLAEHLVRRWEALHERFRREMVKAAPRGLVIDGREMPVEGYSRETLSVGTVCDGCGAEMPEGSVGSMHVRTGQLYCQACWKHDGRAPSVRPRA